MSRTNLRYGGVALLGAVALGSLGHPAALSSATMKATSATPVADAVASLEPKAQPVARTATRLQPAAVTTTASLPTLSYLAIPTLSATASSQGYALRDVAVDAAPDLADRDLSFVLQRLDGETWVDAHSGTTTGATDVVTVPDLPAGTYRVVVAEQYGMAQFVGEPFAHEPRVLGAGISFSAGDVRTLVDVNPDPDVGTGFAFTLQRKASGGWEAVGDFTTGDAAGTYAFKDLASGTYRVVVPDQANAIGTVSDEVAVTSAADQRAAEEKAAAQKAAAERAAAARRAAQQQAAQQRQARPANPAPAAAPDPAPAEDGPAPVGDGGDGGDGIVGTAMAQVGDAYRLGATGPNAFDCSGLTSYAYRAAGISIPRTAASQYASARKVSDPQPGDLVFFLNGAQHVGIYLGGGRMVHAANPGRGVEVTSINSGWYARTFTGYGRY